MQALNIRVVEDYESVASLNKDVDGILGLPSLPRDHTWPRMEELMRLSAERELSRALDRRRSWPSSDIQLNNEVSNRSNVS